MGVIENHFIYSYIHVPVSSDELSDRVVKVNSGGECFSWSLVATPIKDGEPGGESTSISC